MTQITGRSDVNISMANDLHRGAQESRDNAADHMRGVQHFYEQDTTDSWGRHVNEVVGQTHATSNETFDQQTMLGRGVNNANDHLMNAVRQAVQQFR